MPSDVVCRSVSARVHPGRRAAGLALLLCVTPMAGCAAAPPSAPEPEPATYRAPDGVTTLAALGFTQGPAAQVPIPAEPTITQRVDQPNVVSASFSAPAGERFGEVLRQELPEAGWTITVDTNGSLLFDRPGWDGAFTVAERVSALTVRAVPT